MRTSPADVLFRCDGGTALGLGHVKRCIALAAALRANHECKAHFVGEFDPPAATAIAAAGFPQSSLRQEDEAVALAKLAKAFSARAVVFDIRTDLDPKALRMMRGEGVGIVTLDDGSPRRLAADLAILPPTREALAMTWPDFKGEALIGWAWTVLATPPPAASAAQDGTARLLVSMGGSDPKDLTRRAARLLLPLDRRAKPFFVVGAACHVAEAVRADLAALWPGAEIVFKPPSLAPLIARADLALVAYGVTAQELAAAGVPALYLAISEDHQRSAESLAATGAGAMLGRADQLSDQEICDAVASLIADPAKRRQMSVAGRKAIDGGGAQRVAARIASLLDQR